MRPGILVVLACLSLAACDQKSSEQQAAGPAPGTCAADWRKCASNADMAKSWTGWADLRAQCEAAVEAQSPSGLNVWPPDAFSHVNPGNSYVTSGSAVGIEPEAKLLNGTDAGSAKIVCEYDLKARHVASLVQLPN
ncbi:MAG TPA: hypothetical protein VNU97_00625 [Rhizomicrobium sp.]|nr:hypothetical protein [Rhizomicrobium sp.]